MAKPLTVRSIEAVKPGPSRREIADGAMPGLYLVVQPKKQRDGKELPPTLSWAVRYRYASRPRKMTIGPYPAFSLVQAREAAAAAIRRVAEGRDPGAEKLASEAERSDEDNLVSNVLDDFMRRYVKVENRESTAGATETFIGKYVKPKWKRRNIQSIAKRDVIELLDGIANGGAPASAVRVHAILRRFFNWCVERDILFLSPMATIKPPSPGESRDRVLADEELRLLWKACEKVGWPFGSLVKILMVTAQRREEVSGASWSEFDMDSSAPLWVIPKERAKNGKEHAVPLSPLARDLFKGLPAIDGKAKLVLTTTGKTPVSGFSRAKANLDKVMNDIAKEEAVERGQAPEELQPIEPWTFHDLRRTAASGMAALGVPVHVVEAVLNHKSGTIKGVAAVYNRYDYAKEKRDALTGWAVSILRAVGTPSSQLLAEQAKVIKMRSSGRG